LFEGLVLIVIGVLAAITANAVRASGSIKFTRNYFDKGSNRAANAAEAATDRSADHAGLPMEPESASDCVNPGGCVSQQEADAPHEHVYQPVTFEEVVALFNESMTLAGACVFLDARSRDAYEEGHIPGAIQADHYEIDECIDTVLAYVESADQIIVYCNGGDCEDSIFLCCDLTDFAVPCDRIRVYPGGWEEWSTSGMPIATGREPG
jgi:rhodanese-related sulfurtransferase